MDKLTIAVLGHSGAGKSALLQTLCRTTNLKAVRPGIPDPLQVHGIRFIDTPGLGDPIGLLAYLRELETGPDMNARIRAFLRGPEVHRTFREEATAFTAALSAQLIVYVVDTREALLPKYQYEIDMLTGLGIPLLPVLNFGAHPRSRSADWEMRMRGNALFSVPFDAHQPLPESEAQFYQALGRSVPAHANALREALRQIEQQQQDRRDKARRRIAQMLLATAAMRDTIAKKDLADPSKRDPFVHAFRKKAVALQRDCAADLLDIYGFGQNLTDVDAPAISDRWEADLFNPETLREAGKRLPVGALIGAGLGLGIDLALGGLTLGAGATIGAALGGAAVGGAAIQGTTPFGRKILHKIRGIEEVSVGDDALSVMATMMIELARQLEGRPHANTSPLKIGGANVAAIGSMEKVIAATQAARHYPEWSSANSKKQPERRQKIEQEIMEALAGCVPATEPGPSRLA